MGTFGLVIISVIVACFVLACAGAYFDNHF
jgi:hypothetical protein